MLDKKLTASYKTYLKDNLSKKRYNHSVNVANAAVKLAERYNENKDKAYIAGLVHDAAKELPVNDQLDLVLKSELNVSETEKSSVPLFHAIAGAELIQSLFNIHDEDIIHAVRYHTVACKDMPKLSQIIYLADLISEDRDYKDVKKMRKYCENSLEKGMLEALKFSITDSVKKENTIPASTFEAYNDFIFSESKK